MRIIVCVKQVPASNETRLDPVTHTILRDGAPAVCNPFDEYAVEEALRVKARTGGRITALSMGIPAAEKMLRDVAALGVDDAVLLTDRAFAGSDTLATARALACGVEALGGADLVLCGRMASDGDTAQVGPMLAVKLGIPSVTDVTKIEDIQAASATVTRLTDDGYERVRVTLPALLTVVKEINVPRLPSIAGILAGETLSVRRMTAADVGADVSKVGLHGSATHVVSTSRPDLTRRGLRITGTVAQQAEAVAAILTERKEERA